MIRNHRSRARQLLLMTRKQKKNQNFYYNKTSPSLKQNEIQNKTLYQVGRTSSTPYIFREKEQRNQLQSRSGSPSSQVTDRIKNQSSKQLEVSPKQKLKVPQTTKYHAHRLSEFKDRVFEECKKLQLLMNFFFKESIFVEEKPKKMIIKKKNIKKTLNAKIKITPQEEKIIQRHTQYRCFINKINFSNNICITSPKQMNIPAYSVYIGKGNNSALLRGVFKTRWWWQEVEQLDPTSVNLVWTQLRQNNVINELTAFQIEEDSMFDSNEDTNFESSDSELDNKRQKSFLVRSLPLSQSQGLQQSQHANPPSKPTNYNAIKKLVNENDLRRLMQFMEETGTKDSGVIFSDCSENVLKNIKGIYVSSRTANNNARMHNHLEDNWNLSNKKALFYNMRSYYEALKEDYTKYMPTTFHIQSGTQDKEYTRLVEFFNSRVEEIKEFRRFKQPDNQRLLDKKEKRKAPQNIWIIKPGEITNRGNGISVSDDIQEINKMISSNETYPNGKPKTYIVQLYIDNPFLYNKRKFDIRSYILITSQNGIQKGYWYQEGYIRTTSKEYTTKNINRFIHLTNDAVQSKGEEYGKFEQGNKISFYDFQIYLDLSSEQKLNFFQDVYPKMKAIALDCIKATYGKLDPQRRNNSFELFGLDFMIDDNFKVWLIEANTNPCLELSCPLLKKIIPNLVENALRIAVDPIFPPPFFDEWPQKQKQFAPFNLLENNKFELVFDELVDKRKMQSLLKCLSNNNDKTFFDIEEEEEEEDNEQD